MSTIKKTSSSSSSSRTKKASQPAQNNKPKGPEKNKDARQADKKDGFKASKELQDSKKPGETKDSKKPGDEKDPKKTEEGKDGEKDSLLQKVSDLQKQLDEMKNKKEEKPQSPGGCCGGSKKAEKAEDAQKQDPDSELTQLAVAVMQGGNNPMSAGQQQPGQAAKPGVNGVSGVKKGPNGTPQGNPAQLRQVLSQKYQQYKTQGVQLRKETEQLVEAALAGGGQPLPGQPQQQPGMPNLGNQSNQQARPLAKAS